jgi:hypothetical protein
MEKPKILIEIYKGLLNRVVSTFDSEIYVLTDDSKELEKWGPVILVRNEEEFQHLVGKIISKEI